MLGVFSLLWLMAGSVSACELCSIYGASNARGESGRGCIFTVSEQYVSAPDLRYEGKPFPVKVKFLEEDYLNTSITHLVPGYNFSDRFGLNVNIPIVRKQFKRSDFRFASTGAGITSALQDEEGTESGLGDTALIGRWTVFRTAEMSHFFAVTLLGGIKFPTGNTDRIKDEVEQIGFYNQLAGPGHAHDPLGLPIGGVHEHDLALGSGSFDGIFGLTWNVRWERWFFNNQIQYYLRTPGESSFQFGDQLMISGGPGAYVLTGDAFTLSLQANAAYESDARDSLNGEPSNHTGMTAWYLGPLLNLTLGEHFSANAGVDIPLRIYNHGVQNVPEYRAHGGVTWRF